ncbi:unnamed protein product [Malus baccata var. baccata]
MLSLPSHMVLSPSHLMLSPLSMLYLFRLQHQLHLLLGLVRDSLTSHSLTSPHEHTSSQIR